MRIVIALVALVASAAPVLAQGVTHTYANGWVSTDFPRYAKSRLLDRERRIGSRRPPGHGRQHAQTRPGRLVNPPDGVVAARRDDAGPGGSFRTERR